MFVVKCGWKLFKPSCRICFFITPHLALQIPDIRFDGVIHLSVHHLCNLSPFSTVALILKVKITLRSHLSPSLMLTSSLIQGYWLGLILHVELLQTGWNQDMKMKKEMAGIWRLVIFICSYNLMTSKCLNHCSSDQYAAALKMDRMTEGGGAAGINSM